MAYNLQSLVTILEQILNPEETRWILDDDNKAQLKSLIEKAASLEKILENSSLTKIESLESQIRDAAHKAEDIIESYMVDQMLSSPQGVSFTFSTPDLHHVTQELDSAMEQVVKLMKEKKISTESSSSGDASFSHGPSTKSAVVGIDADLWLLKGRLIGMKSKLEIVPIVGMGGIGKTTLARKLYEDPLIVYHFTCLAWTTISQDYNMKAILSGLLRCIIGKEEFDKQHIGKKSDELKDILYKSLFGRRYMIVLDDIWNTKFWDEIRRYFPDNNEGSRIVITTRECDVATYADSQSLQHQVQLLTKSESWNLLRQIVFGEEDCDDHVLQGIGEKIASDCGGLPLAINVIGGLLSKLQKSKDVWENIATDVKAAIAESDKHFADILYLSYNHLPNHLRPCFLYMGAFPDDYEIKGSRLVRLWVAEGFVKSKGDDKRSLEEEAEDCLKALVERNLLLVVRKKSNGNPMSYSMHDLLRDLSMRKAEEEKFLHLKNATEITFSNLRRVCVYTPYGLEGGSAEAEKMPLARSFLLSIKGYLDADEIPPPIFFASRLLRVLDLIGIRFEKFPREILQLVNLRYLAVRCNRIPGGISRLFKLQSLIASLHMGDAPSDLWEMPELRHIKSESTIRIDEEEYMNKFVQKKLQTISGWMCLTASLIRRGFFENIPNIKNLGIRFVDGLRSSAVDLSHLHKLETLRFIYYVYGPRPLAKLIFPCSLRKLSLWDCAISPGFLTTLCALPNLEVLKIEVCVFQSSEEGPPNGEWEAAEGDIFRTLQYLQLGYLELERWRADETNFPRLRHLRLRSCYKLEEIPSGIGEIPTLQLIQLNRCSDSAVASAQQIVEVQQSDYDNYHLQLHIYIN